MASDGTDFENWGKNASILKINRIILRFSCSRLFTWTASRTESYSYDNAGNLLTFYNGSTSHSYTYGDSQWGDLLTAVDGQSIQYDAIGNPTSYYDGYRYTFTWEQGRQLKSSTCNNWTTNYRYNEDGLRTEKYWADGSSVKYDIVDGKTVGEIRYGANGVLSLYMRYIFDEAGSVTGIGIWTAGSGQWTDYYFVKNLQGDVVEVYGKDNTLAASYTYDAWGNILTKSGDLADINPFRYRTYYFDKETWFYYVSSRYYDPAIGRWINADSVIAGVGGNVKGYNLFAYCFNNPINMDDPTGNWPQCIKNTVKWLAKNIVKPVVKTVQKTLSKVDLTYSTGVNVSGTPSAWIFNGQIGVSMDTKGNVAIQASGGGGITGGDPGVSITRYHSITNAPNIDKLNGAYYQIGGSIAGPIEGVPVAAGGDVMFMPDTELNTGYFGLTGNVGLGSPGKEFHVEWGTTVTLPYTHFNIYEVASSVYNKIMEW